MSDSKYFINHGYLTAPDLDLSGDQTCICFAEVTNEDAARFHKPADWLPCTEAEFKEGTRTMSSLFVAQNVRFHGYL